MDEPNIKSGPKTSGNQDKEFLPPHGRVSFEKKLGN